MTVCTAAISEQKIIGTRNGNIDTLDSEIAFIVIDTATKIVLEQRKKIITGKRKFY